MIAIAMLAATSFVELAKPARSFVDSIGINTHFAYADTAYGTRFDAVAQKLVALGIRHVRDGIAPGRSDVCERERSLAAQGVRFTYVVPQTIDASGLAAWAACAGPAIEAIEGTNEYDLTHPVSDPAWMQTLRAATRRLHDAVRANPVLRARPLLAPSLTTRDAFRAVGDLRAYVDAGNVHDYFGGHEPGTSGYGGGGYGSIAYALSNARYVCDAKPVYATETGYGTSSAPGDLSEDDVAAYLPRVFLDHFAAGVVRTDVYELVDEGPAPFGHYGLLHADGTPKPAYVALQSLVAFVDDAEPKAASRRPRLRFGLSGGDGNDVRHALFQKADGRFLLALWAERPSVEPHTHLPYPLPEIAITVSADRRATMRAFAFASDNQLMPSGDRAAGRALTVGLRDRAVFVEIREPAEGGIR